MSTDQKIWSSNPDRGTLLLFCLTLIHIILFFSFVYSYSHILYLIGIIGRSSFSVLPTPLFPRFTKQSSLIMNPIIFHLWSHSAILISVLHWEIPVLPWNWWLVNTEINFSLKKFCPWRDSNPWPSEQKLALEPLS